MVEPVKIDLVPDGCRHYQFFHDWIPGKLLAIHLPGLSRFNPTARNRLNFCKKKGYIIRQGWNYRNSHLEDIYQINISMPQRQGKRMAEDYWQKPVYSDYDNQCSNHYIEFLGCFKDKKLVGYIEAYFIGQLCNISRILGHRDYLKDGIMLYLIDELVKVCEKRNIKALIYNQWVSGTAGLQYFKHSTGFLPMELSEC